MNVIKVKIEITAEMISKVKWVKARKRDQVELQRKK